MTKIISGSDEPFKFKARSSGKKVLQFWSGGADSTYLLLQNLLCGHKVILTYVNIKNNRTKSEREQNARQLLQKDIEKFRRYFYCQLPIYLPDHEILVKGSSFGRCPAKQPVIFAMFALLIGTGFDEIQLGTVQGDSMCGERFNQSIVKVFNSHFLTGNFPEITYPIENISKETIYLALQGYDKLLGTSFLNHITVCESVTKPCGEEKFCLPCQTQQEVFKRLKWVK